jgi:hypothetical protein
MAAPASIIMIKAAVRKRDGFRCTQCGRTNEEHIEMCGLQLDVHRLVPGSEYTVDGCVTLCKTCHAPKPRRRAGQEDRASCYVKVQITRREYAALRELAERECSTPRHHLKRAIRDYLPEERRRQEERRRRYEVLAGLAEPLDELVGRTPPAARKRK